MTFWRFGRLIRLLVFLAIASACTSGTTSSGPTGPTTTAAAPIETAMQVIAETTGQPIAGATVRVEKGNKEGTTDASGKVAFQSVDPTTRIQIEAMGYLTRITTIQQPGVYGLLGPRGDLSAEFLQEFIFGDLTGRGNSRKPQNNRIDVVLDDPIFWGSDVEVPFASVCRHIQAVGYGCDVFNSIPPRNGNLVIFRYGGTEGQTTSLWQGGNTDRIWTIRGDDGMKAMRNENAVISKLVSNLGLFYHSQPGGAASKVSVSADFSELEKRAIALYMPRKTETCYEDGVMLPVPGYMGGVCGQQVPFGGLK